MAYKKFLFIFLFSMLVNMTTVSAQKNNVETFIIENYYKVKWGFAEEFIAPRQHASDETRWDYRITLVFKNSQTAFDPNLTEPYKKMLFPNLEKLKKHEDHRFELLLAHWDVEVQPVDFEK